MSTRKIKASTSGAKSTESKKAASKGSDREETLLRLKTGLKAGVLDPTIDPRCTCLPTRCRPGSF
jgi:hypothetical protein